MQNYFIRLGLPDNNINILMNLFNSEFEISKVASHFQMITKKRSGDASQFARQALHELKMISQNAEAYGIEVNTTLKVYHFGQKYILKSEPSPLVISPCILMKDERYL